MKFTKLNVDDAVFTAGSKCFKRLGTVEQSEGLSDLTGTTWVLNSNRDFFSLNLTAYATYNIEGRTYFGGETSSTIEEFVERDFTTLYYYNNGSAAYMELRTSSATPYWYNHYRESSVTVGYSGSSTWSKSEQISPLLATISFTGGTDATNPYIIAWLQKNGIQLKVADLTDTTWVIPSGWKATAGYGAFSITTEWISPSTQYSSNYGPTAYKFYIGYKPTANPMTVDNYIAFMYAKSSSSGGASFYYDTIGNNTSVSFTITGGDDVTNPYLIAWLLVHGQLQPTE